jgi:hypothetical protein
MAIFGVCCGHLVCFYRLVYCTKKNLATLLGNKQKTPFLLRQLPASENYAMQLIAVIVAIKFLDVEKLFQ